MAGNTATHRTQRHRERKAALRNAIVVALIVRGYGLRTAETAADTAMRTDWKRAREEMHGAGYAFETGKWSYK